MFYDFSLYDQVDDPATNHRIHACSSYGPDFSELPSSSMKLASADSVDVHFEIGWFDEGFGLAASGIRSLIKQIRKYVDHGHGATDKPFVMYGQSGQAALGLYIGRGLLNQGLSESALKMFEDNLENLNVSTPSLAMQLCAPHYDSTHIFGVMATSNGTFTPIQDAIKAWANATCLSFSGSVTFPGQAMFTAPLLQANRTTTNSTALVKTLHARSECKTVQVVGGDSCATLAKRCGISPADFTKYNPGSSFCSTLKPKQHVCCSSGDLPDLRPKPNPDGSCRSYQVKADDNCDNLAAEYSLTKKDLEDFNKNTWGWNSCKEVLFLDTVMCLSKGTPPFPAPIANAVCGPQKPGSKPPTDDSDISKLNPCPLNACCNIWGQCGITKDFCIDTNTGAPGTAKPGTYGCISNCGLDVVKGDGNGAIKIGYFEGYGMSRECLFQDASQIDTSQYTHIHFGFGTLTTSYEVEVGDALSTYQFGEFKRISGAKRILSFGGWDFSTMPATYAIFRNGVKPANRLTMATKIANFIKKHDLDGVDIDWEYPGAPDLPDIPAADKEDGPNYLAFLVILKNLLRGKSISIAAPSSYWYLKQFPIKEISKIVDYIVYMTYDLHGQWDSKNSNSQEGCDTGNCLRSQVNLTETRQSLAMITKAGVPGRKIVVGVTSYGRSFKMANAGCWGPDCLFTGDRSNSDAKKGKCTGTAGYVADAEIGEIMKDPRRVVKSYIDTSSNSDVLVYDDTEWVGYMSSKTKKTRTSLYSAWGMGGTSDWATDLQQYHDVPGPATSWGMFKELASSGDDPKTDHTRNSSWTKFDCTDPRIADKMDYTPSERWKGLNADAAWRDVVRIWNETDSNRNMDFMQSVSVTLRMGAEVKCQKINDKNCDRAQSCPDGANGKESGPAAQLIWNALARIHEMHSEYYDTLLAVSAMDGLAVDDLLDRFAPVPKEDDKTGLFLLIDLITLGTVTAAGPFFNNFLHKLAYFAKNEATYNNVKDTTINIIGQSTTIAKDMSASELSPWTPGKQHSFANFMGQTIKAWRKVASLAVRDLFNGTSEMVEILGQTISDGKLTEGKRVTRFPDPVNATEELEANIAKCWFGYSIPVLWQASNTYAFVIDPGHDGCGEDKSLSAYLNDTTMEATGVCYEKRRYYLVYPGGDSKECHCVPTGGGCQNTCKDRKFSAPPGLDSLDGEIFGGITKEHLVKGSVGTWKKNNKKNGGGFTDPTNKGNIEKLLDVDVTTPGFMRIPVCSPERAFQSWDTSKRGSSDNYPCDNPPGRDHCGQSTFVDQTSSASPKIDDCRKIIHNIEGNGGTEWTTQVVGKKQREIAKSGSCSFGVEATKVDSNVHFKVGGQDVIDLINSAINKFGNKDGRVGAKGDMKCTGNIKKQDVKWGIY